MEPDGTLGHAVYRKPFHTNDYLNAKSHHHLAQKQGVLNSLMSYNKVINYNILYIIYLSLIHI